MKLQIYLLDKKIAKITRTIKEKQKLWYLGNVMTKVT